ncbi:uncharacterized protein EV422DRAFT_231633 [Fimicolochytrium jonesii]|uniref:uncharacterized protein n=1 Tax=Fimicolochytrium jonesii TaxID=1396493 RepID=UPI0022FF03E4|nr:uncharacterized protein EV422DRAFT_231633 [Fimicolochytrium jonesii]KAI8817309.1 hypothetical protein EV422DRAFT_231633 [Fimicolochytrium jonesii]
MLDDQRVHQQSVQADLAEARETIEEAQNRIDEPNKATEARSEEIEQQRAAIAEAERNITNYDNQLRQSTEAQRELEAPLAARTTELDTVADYVSSMAEVVCHRNQLLIGAGQDSPAVRTRYDRIQDLGLGGLIGKYSNHLLLGCAHSDPNERCRKPTSLNSRCAPGVKLLLFLRPTHPADPTVAIHQCRGYLAAHRAVGATDHPERRLGAALARRDALDCRRRREPALHRAQDCKAYTVGAAPAERDDPRCPRDGVRATHGPRRHAARLRPTARVRRGYSVWRTHHGAGAPRQAARGQRGAAARLDPSAAALSVGAEGDRAPVHVHACTPGAHRVLNTGVEARSGALG